MSHTCQQYGLIFGPKNHIFIGSALLYFLSLFSDHPVPFCLFQEITTQITGLQLWLMMLLLPNLAHFYSLTKTLPANPNAQHQLRVQLVSGSVRILYYNIKQMHQPQIFFVA